MALFVYITDECKEDAKKYNREDDVLGFKERIEKAQRYCHFDNFPPPYLKKRFDRQIRLIAKYDHITLSEDEDKQEEHTVVIFLRIFTRSSSDYSKFQRNAPDFGERYLEPLVDVEKVKASLQEALLKNEVPQKQPPKQIEQKFLYQFYGNEQESISDTLVCESEKWVEKVQDKKVQQVLVYFFDEIPNLVNVDSEVRDYKIRDFYVVFRYFNNLDKLFLAGIAEDKEGVQELLKKYVAILSAEEKEITKETILQNSLRAYPLLILADQESWFEIQNDRESNLALSPEESEILESAHATDGGFPIFINGRAGSGKSTILYYLFSDYVKLYLDNKESELSFPEPVLFSSSEELRRKSYNTVCNLIKYNQKHRQEGENYSSVSEKPFKHFHKYLWSLLPDDHRLKFKKSGYVDYARFRKLWMDQFGNEKKLIKEAGPDISWYIIRTYIKGTNPEDYVEPEEYQELPKKQQTVSLNAFMFVFERIWLAWYKDLASEGFWDDQDLARHLFKYDLIESKFPAIFCDEAQDFTRVELDIVFQLSIFTDRKFYNKSDLSRVPFAFAGDPFQTLNPTGFRWDDIKASLHEKLDDAMGKDARNSIKLNYCELNLNYRSTKQIVKFSNFIQSVRAALFEIKNLKPQETWKSEKNSPLPVWFDLKSPDSWSKLKDEKDITIIVPCMLNEETEYVRSHKLLSDIVETDETGIPVNVLSPARAKGLEFGRVALYGFADDMPGNLEKLLKGMKVKRDELLACEYYVNQLYVSVTRPKRRLFIIDSLQGRNALWELSMNKTKMNEILQSLQDEGEKWFDHIGGFIQGNESSWEEERGDVVENAKQYEEQGMAQRDSFLLRSAAGMYNTVGNTAESARCLAFANKFEENYLEAGDLFRDAGDVKEALECYWTSGTGAKDRILALSEKHSNISKSIEYELIAALESQSIEKIKKATLRLRDDSKRSSSFQSRLLEQDTFEKILKGYIRIIRNDNKQTSIKLIKSIISALHEIGDYISIDYDDLAHLYYQVNDYEGAVGYWEKGKKYLNNEDYKDAKKKLLHEKYKENKHSEIPVGEIKQLYEFYKSSNDYHMMIDIALKSERVKDIVDTLADIPVDVKGWELILQGVIKKLSENEEWELVANMALASEGAKVRALPRDLAKKMTKKKHEVFLAVIRQVAVHKTVTKQNNQVLKKFSDYFKKTLYSPTNWRKEIPLVAAGAAIEHAGRHIDILPFYERIINDTGFSEEEIAFAKERWVITKEKQANREREAGNIAAAKKHSVEAVQKRTEYKLMKKDIKEYPQIDQGMTFFKLEKNTESELKEREKRVKEERVEAKEPAPQAQDNKVSKEAFIPETDVIKFQIIDLEILYSREKGRINVTNTETLDSASIRSDRRDFASNDIKIAKRDKDIFLAEEWDIVCDYTAFDKEKKIRLTIIERGITLEFELS